MSGMADIVASFFASNGQVFGHILLPDEQAVTRFAVEFGLCPQIPAVAVEATHGTLLHIRNNQLVTPRSAAGPILLARTIYQPLRLPIDDTARRQIHELVHRIRHLSATGVAPHPADYDHQVNALDRRLLALAVATDINPIAINYHSVYDKALNAPSNTPRVNRTSWTLPFTAS
jgi:hypothetical protein